MGWVDTYHFQFELHIDRVLAPGSAWSWLHENDVIAIAGHYSDPLEEGQRYLTFLSPHSIDSRETSRINDDGTITAIQNRSYISPFDGYTVEQMQDIALQYWGVGWEFYYRYVHQNWCAWPDSMFCRDYSDIVAIYRYGCNYFAHLRFARFMRTCIIMVALYFKLFRQLIRTIAQYVTSLRFFTNRKQKEEPNAGTNI